MLEWGQRILFCQALLSEMIDLTSPECGDLKSQLTALTDYVESDDFKVKDIKMKESESICMLGDVLRECHNTYDAIAKRAYSDHMDENGRKMTLDEAKNELCKKYLEAVKEGDAEVLGMNINDWINQNMIVIVDKKRRGRKKKSDE